MLSDKAREVYQFLLRYAEEHGYPPTIREIGEQFGIQSTNGVRHHLSVLERAGYIRRNSKISRGLELVEGRRPSSLRPGAEPPMSPSLERPIGIPLLGRVAAGSPTVAEEMVEDHLTLEGLFPTSGDLFALRVRGTSMRDAGILEGDIVIVRKQDYARDGDQVVALLGDDATVKTYLRGREGIELHPANEEFEARRISSEEDFRILGVVVGLVRPPSIKVTGMK